MSDRNEKSRTRDLSLGPVAMADTDSGHSRIVSEHLLHLILKQHLQIGRTLYPTLHRLRSPQVIFTHNKIDLFAQRCQIGSLLAGRIATSYDNDILPPIEKSITRRTSRHTHSFESLFRFQSEIFRLGTHRYNHAFGLDRLRSVDRNAKRPLRKIDRGDQSHPHIGSENLSLLLHLLHQRVGIDSF